MKKLMMALVFAVLVSIPSYVGTVDASSVGLINGKTGYELTSYGVLSGGTAVTSLTDNDISTSYVIARNNAKVVYFDLGEDYTITAILTHNKSITQGGVRLFDSEKNIITTRSFLGGVENQNETRLVEISPINNVRYVELYNSNSDVGSEITLAEFDVFSVVPTPTPTPEPTDEIPPDVPTGLVAQPDNGQVILSWTANAEIDLDGYFVYVDGIKLNTEPITVITDTVTALTNGIEYSFQISAVDISGNESALSTAIKATPSNELTVSMVGNGTSIVLYVSGGLPPYEIDWVESSEIGVTVNTFYIPNLTKDTEYTVTVTDSESKFVTQVVNTGSTVSYLPPVMPDSTSMFQSLVNSFTKAGQIALVIIAGAVSLGLIVILAMWAWRMLKKWLSTAK